MEFFRKNGRFIAMVVAVFSLLIAGLNFYTRQDSYLIFVFMACAFILLASRMKRIKKQ